MTENVTNELMYEVMKAIQARLGNMEEAMREQRGQLAAIRTDLQAIRTEISAVKTDISNIYQANGAFDSRLARVERRLEITDTPH
jgi:septal ring factor EnvC (AmiA/AmiB activator)